MLSELEAEIVRFETERFLARIHERFGKPPPLFDRPTAPDIAFQDSAWPGPALAATPQVALSQFAEGDHDLVGPGLHDVREELAEPFGETPLHLDLIGPGTSSWR